MNANFNFRYLRNIQSSHQLNRLVVALVIICSVGLIGWNQWLTHQTVEQSREKIYTVDPSGKTIMLAYAQDQNANRPAEAKDHVKTFLKLFFNQEPDEKAIDENMKQAAYLGDESITRHYYDLREKGFYTKLLQGNTIEKILVDSVNMDMTRSPYSCTINARIMLIRATNITFRRLKADCSLIDARRTDNNPHGFLIERFRVTDNSDIETINRDQYNGYR
jgi:conjugative transposon TraK protein